MRQKVSSGGPRPTTATPRTAAARRRQSERQQARRKWRAQCPCRRCRSARPSVVPTPAARPSCVSSRGKGSLDDESHAVAPPVSLAEAELPFERARATRLLPSIRLNVGPGIQQSLRSLGSRRSTKMRLALTKRGSQSKGEPGKALADRPERGSVIAHDSRKLGEVALVTGPAYRADVAYPAYVEMACHTIGAQEKN